MTEKTEKKGVMCWICENKKLIIFLAIGFILGRRSVSTQTMRILVEGV